MNVDDMEYQGWKRRLTGAEVFFPPEDEVAEVSISMVQDQMTCNRLRRNHGVECSVGQYVCWGAWNDTDEGHYPVIADSLEAGMNMATERFNIEYFYSVPQMFKGCSVCGCEHKQSH